MDRPVEITRSYAECKFCNDIADMCNEIPDCTHCENRKGTWIDTITSLLGTKAVVVLEDGKVETYPLDRLKVISNFTADPCGSLMQCLNGIILYPSLFSPISHVFVPSVPHLP